MSGMAANAFGADHKPAFYTFEEPLSPVTASATHSVRRHFIKRALCFDVVLNTLTTVTRMNKNVVCFAGLLQPQRRFSELLLIARERKSESEGGRDRFSFFLHYPSTHKQSKLN